MWARKGTRPWQGWLSNRKLLDMTHHVGEGDEDVAVFPTRGMRRLDAILMSPEYAQYKHMLEYETFYLSHGGDHALVWVSWGKRESRVKHDPSPSIRHWRKPDIRAFRDHMNKWKMPQRTAAPLSTLEYQFGFCLAILWPLAWCQGRTGQDSDTELQYKQNTISPHALTCVGSCLCRAQATPLSRLQ